jgi:hypothetical protein
MGLRFIIHGLWSMALEKPKLQLTAHNIKKYTTTTPQSLVQTMKIVQEYNAEFFSFPTNQLRDH